MCCYAHNLYNNAKKFHALWSFKQFWGSKFKPRRDCMSDFIPWYNLLVEEFVYII